MCQTGAEDIKHALFSSNRAREVWGALGIWDVIEKLLSVDRSGSVLIQEIIGRRGLATGLSNVGVAELILKGCWYIWWQRRQVVHGEEIQNPPRSAVSIAAISTNYALASMKSAVTNNTCKKPAEGLKMINVDASYDAAKGVGSTGAVIRDAAGGFVAAAHSYIPHVVDAAMAEAFALRDDLLLAQ